MTKDEGVKASVANNLAYFRVDNGKANLAPPSDAKWLKFVSVDLGNGTDDFPGDSVGVATAWTWPNAFADLTTNDLLRVQQRIAEGEWRESSQAKAWAGIAVADVLGLDITEPSVKERVKQLLKTWIRTRRSWCRTVSVLSASRLTSSRWANGPNDGETRLRNLAKKGASGSQGCAPCVPHE
jgi:hypothetical protein